jgi:hypothetical protein
MLIYVRSKDFVVDDMSQLVGKGDLNAFANFDTLEPTLFQCFGK